MRGELRFIIVSSSEIRFESNIVEAKLSDFLVLQRALLATADKMAEDLQKRLIEAQASKIVEGAFGPTGPKVVE